MFCLKGVDCITDHAKFRIVCLDTDVLNTAIHNSQSTLKSLAGPHRKQASMPSVVSVYFFFPNVSYRAL